MGNRPALRRDNRIMDLRQGLVFIRIQNYKRNFHGFQKIKGNLALLLMLGFVFCAGLTAPADQQKKRKAVHFLVRKGQEGIHRISQTGVLHINQRNVARSHIITAGNAHRGTFIGGDDMLTTRSMIRDIGANILQKGIGNTRKEVNTVMKERIVYLFYTYHNRLIYLVPGINSRISLIGIQSGRTSSARSFSRMVLATFIMAG